MESDIQYDKNISTENKNSKTNDKTNFYDYLRATNMLKDTNEYDLFDSLNNTNARITFGQLFSVSPLLRRLCIKRLKLNPNYIRKINSIYNFNECKIDNESLEKSTTNHRNRVYHEELESLDLNNSPHSNLKNNINIIQKSNIASVMSKIKDIPVKVLIDTGSNVNVINKSFFKKISSQNQSKKNEETFFKLASNTVIRSNSTVDLCLSFKNTNITSKFWILDDKDSCYDIILGRTSQKEHRLYIDPDDDALYKKTDNKPICVANPVPFLNSVESIFTISIRNYKQKTSNLEDLANEETSTLNNLLKEFDDVLVDSIEKVSIAKVEPHSIELTNLNPIKLRPYKISLEKSNALKEEIIKLLKHGFIEPSHSPWSFPVILIKKKNGKWRLCVDY